MRKVLIAAAFGAGLSTGTAHGANPAFSVLYASHTASETSAQPGRGAAGKLDLEIGTRAASAGGA